MVKALFLSAVSLVLGFACLAQDADPVSQADALFLEVESTAYTPEAHAALQEKLLRAISLYEQALAADESNIHVLTELAHAYYVLADVFEEDTKEKIELHVKGQEYAERALRADPDFAALEKEKGFIAAVKAHGNVAALFWTYSNWARKIELGGALALLAAAVRGDDKKLYALMERCLELDPGFEYGGPLRALAGYWAKHPFKKDFDRVNELLTRAMEAYPQYLENKLFYVQYYLMPKKMWAEAKEMLEEILAADLGEGDVLLQNGVAKVEAAKLLEEVEEELG
ncbi:TRAP transporter TatT component family protein [Candidatus Bipolaricaulota sp. J31]